MAQVSAIRLQLAVVARRLRNARNMFLTLAKNLVLFLKQDPFFFFRFRNRYSNDVRWFHGPSLNTERISAMGRAVGQLPFLGCQETSVTSVSHVVIGQADGISAGCFR